MAIDKDSVTRYTSSVFDKGRRGEPLPGCDCMCCFGYCIIDRDKAERDVFSQSDGAKPKDEGLPEGFV